MGSGAGLEGDGAGVDAGAADDEDGAISLSAELFIGRLGQDVVLAGDNGEDLEVARGVGGGGVGGGGRGGRRGGAAFFGRIFGVDMEGGFDGGVGQGGAGFVDDAAEDGAGGGLGFGAEEEGEGGGEEEGQGEGEGAGIIHDKSLSLGVVVAPCEWLAA